MGITNQDIIDWFTEIDDAKKKREKVTKRLLEDYEVNDEEEEVIDK